MYVIWKLLRKSDILVSYHSCGGIRDRNGDRD